MSELASPDAVGLKVVRAAGIITLASVIGYLVSFAKAAVVAAYMGTGWQMDVFLWSFALVSLFATVTSASLTAVLVPVYLSLKARDIRLARDLFNAVLGLLILALVGLGGVLVTGAPAAARLLGGELGPEGTTLAIRLVWLMVPVVLFSGVWTACQAVLNAENSFFWPALSSSFRALAVILVLMVAGRERAVYAQAIGLSLGALAQGAVLMALLWQKGLGRRWTLSLHVEGMGQFLKLLWPLVVTQALLLCLPIVDRTMAARFSPGSISALGYAQTLMTMSATVFLTALHTAILPFLSQQVAEDGLAAFRKTFVPTIRILVALLIPVCVLLIVLQKPVIRLVFERGAFDAEATGLTAPAFAAYLAGVVPMAVTFICSRGFNALQDSKTNALIGILLLVTVKLVMNVILTRLWSYLGLALATSVAYTATAVAMLWVMQRRLGSIEGKRLIQTAGKTLAASFSAGLLAWWGASVGRDHPLLQLALGGTLATLGYGLAAYFLRLEDIQRLSARIARFVWAQGRMAVRGVRQ